MRQFAPKKSHEDMINEGWELFKAHPECHGIYRKFITDDCPIHGQAKHIEIENSTINSKICTKCSEERKAPVRSFGLSFEEKRLWKGLEVIERYRRKPPLEREKSTKKKYGG